MRTKNHLAERELVKQRDAAFRQWNPLNFRRLCNKTGYDRELMARSISDSERVLYEQGGDLESEGFEATDTSDRDILRSTRSHVDSGRGFGSCKISLKIYKDLYDRVQASEINPEDPFSHIEEKRKLIGNVFGYRSLRARGGSILLEDCSGRIIGGAFMSMYETAKRKLGKK